MFFFFLSLLLCTPTRTYAAQGWTRPQSSSFNRLEEIRGSLGPTVPLLIDCDPRSWCDLKSSNYSNEGKTEEGWELEIADKGNDFAGVAHECFLLVPKRARNSSATRADKTEPFGTAKKV